MLQVQAVPAHVDKAISAMKLPASRLCAVALDVLGGYFYPANVCLLYMYFRKRQKEEI